MLDISTWIQVHIDIVKDRAIFFQLLSVCNNVYTLVARQFVNICTLLCGIIWQGYVKLASNDDTLAIVVYSSFFPT